MYRIRKKKVIDINKMSLPHLLQLGKDINHLSVHKIYSTRNRDTKTARSKSRKKKKHGTNLNNSLDTNDEESEQEENDEETVKIMDSKHSQLNFQDP